MGLSVAQGTLTAKTGTTGNKAETGIGFVPKLLILYATTQTATGFATGGNLAFGAATSTTERRAIAFASDTGVTTSNTGRRHAALAISLLSAGTPTVIAEADFVSFDADGFTLNWTTVHATNAYLVHYLALGGTDLTNVKVGEFALPTTTTNPHAITDPGFQPDCVLLYGVADDVVLPSAATQGTVCFGAATSSSARWANAYRNRDNVGTTELSKYQRTAFAYVELQNAGTVRSESDFVAFTATGFNLNVSAAPASADRVFYIAMKGAQFKVGAETARTTTGTKATSGFGFQPAAILLTSFGGVASSSASVTSGATTLGSGTSSTSRGNVWTMGSDAVTTTDEDQSTITNKIIRFATSTPTVSGEADLASLDADGFTLDWTTAPGAALEFLYFGIGAAPVTATRPVPAVFVSQAVNRAATF